MVAEFLAVRKAGVSETVVGDVLHHSLIIRKGIGQ
jgi:hypothetical protein